MRQKSLEDSLLIKVSATFELSSCLGVLIAPLFIVPDGFIEEEWMVRVESPCKNKTNQMCRLRHIRFRLKDGKHIYRLQLHFPAATKRNLPVGSTIFSSSDVLLNLHVAS